MPFLNSAVAQVILKIQQLIQKYFLTYLALHWNGLGCDLNQVKAAKTVILILPGFGININISLINMESFYLESCSLFNTTLDLNIILVCKIFAVFVL